MSGTGTLGCQVPAETCNRLLERPGQLLILHSPTVPEFSPSRRAGHSELTGFLGPFPSAPF
jgi:hypothetical protein